MKNWRSRVLNGNKIKFSTDDISILKFLAVSSGYYINAGHGIEIGGGTLWAGNVSFISMNHDFKNLSFPANSKEKIVIEKKCWIGTGAVILPGVVIGDHSVVEANAVVSKSFPEGNVVIGGVPAKIIKQL